jgi:hypothetical protein
MESGYDANPDTENLAIGFDVLSRAAMLWNPRTVFDHEGRLRQLRNRFWKIFNIPLTSLRQSLTRGYGHKFLLATASLAVHVALSRL